MARLRRKWRPSLALVLGGGLVGTLGLSLVGLIALRYLGPEIGFRIAAALLAVMIGLATGCLGYLMVRLLLRPITALADYSTTVQKGEAAEPPTHYGTRELSQLAGSVLDMTGTLQRREASIRGFADHVTHELKTPVTAIRAAGELLQDSGQLDGPDRKLVHQILGATDQMQSQLRALNQVTAARRPEYHGTACLADLLDWLQSDFPELDITVQGRDKPMPLAASGLRVVLRQMLDNSVRHRAGRVFLTATERKLVIQDDGPGISAGNRDHIFEPFFTTAREKGGTGMGLTIAANLLSAHGAGIVLVPSDSGARFEIEFRSA